MRYNRRYHIDILATLGALLLLVLATKMAMASGARQADIFLATAFLWLLQPYFLLRLVDHFRPVPRWVKWSAISFATSWLILLALLPRPRPAALSGALPAYFLLMQGFAVWAFAAEARISEGVTRWRLRLAGAGAVVAIAFVLLDVTARIFGTRLTPLVGALLSLALLGCFYVGLDTPRWIRTSWRRAELYRFLKRTAERSWDEREQHVAADLQRAVVRSVQAVTVAVLLGQERLRVAVSTDPHWKDLTVSPDDGLLGRVSKGASGLAGRRADCEAGLRDRLTSEFVTVVPIVTGSRHWGVLVVVQRRESLFLEEDLDLLQALCRQAADILDHARLLNAERDREQRLADARVRESESRLAIMVDSLADYMLVELDDRGAITSWNRGAEQMFGYPAEVILGHPATRLIGDGQGPSFTADLESARQGRRPAREGPFRRQDGTTFVGASLLVRLRHEGEDFGGFVMATRDVTEQRRLEARVNQGQKMEAVGRLAAGVAHDFNNLLTVIMGFAALNEDELPADHRLRDDITEIRKASERAAALVRQLLAFSRRQVVEPRPLQPAHVVSELLPMLRRLLGDRVQIVDHLDARVMPVLADPNQLEQIVVNLSVNARDAMPDGGRLTIRLSSTTLDGSWTGSYPEPRPGPYTVIEVTDNGTGMDAATLSHIFEPFFTTKDVGKGTGLGLATVYGLVQQMGGAIHAASEPGLGTTFKIYLPGVTAAEAAARPARRRGAPRGTETVLIAEDESQIRRYVSSILTRAGYTVLASGSPAEALEVAAGHEGALHILVSDMIMPGGTGPELATELKALRPDVRVLFVSGNADFALASRGDVTLDASTFLQKPFTADQLLTRVRQVLDEPELAGMAPRRG